MYVSGTLALLKEEGSLLYNAYFECVSVASYNNYYYSVNSVCPIGFKIDLSVEKWFGSEGFRILLYEL